MANDELRVKTVEIAKKHKSSWIELGQHLFSIYKNKLYKEWGYQAFETYCHKELGIKDATASKLLKSYAFLEKEEPVYLEKERSPIPQEAATLPSYESVNLLRLAKDKKTIDGNDYQRFKKDVLERGKEPCQFRKDLTSLIRQREELEPEAAKQVKIYLILAAIAKKENIAQDDHMPRRVMEFLLREANWKVETA